MKYIKRLTIATTFAAGAWWAYAHQGTINTVQRYLDTSCISSPLEQAIQKSYDKKN